MGDLADHSGLNKTYVGQIERGERNPSAWSVVVLADGLGVTPDDLLLPDLAENQADEGVVRQPPRREGVTAETALM
jgi:transcriptional regulator with XRE-family HTH domain